MVSLTTPPLSVVDAENNDSRLFVQSICAVNSDSNNLSLEYIALFVHPNLIYLSKSALHFFVIVFIYSLINMLKSKSSLLLSFCHNGFFHGSKRLVGHFSSHLRNNILPDHNLGILCFIVYIWD